MRILFALILITLTAGAGEAAHSWANNITVNEYSMTWNYTETFAGMSSEVYRTSIDLAYGNNDSFVSAWELLKADRETRKNFRESIGREPDVRINNKTSDVEVVDVDSRLSPDVIGKTHISDTIVNKYSVTYRFKESIFNASSLWFLGQAKSPVTIVMPAGVDVLNVSGMNNVTNNIIDHAEIGGSFKEISRDRGEITLTLARNTSVQIPEKNTTQQATDNAAAGNVTKPMTAMVLKIRDISILIIGMAIILLIYVFKVKKR